MQIPKQFNLMGRTITVKWCDDLSHTEDAKGRANYVHGTIELQKNTKHTPYPPEDVELTFCHEFMHLLLYFARDEGFDPPLHNREVFVDRLAGLLHQAFNSMEYEEPRTGRQIMDEMRLSSPEMFKSYKDIKAMIRPLDESKPHIVCTANIPGGQCLCPECSGK